MDGQLTRELVKNYLRVDGDEDDEYITLLIEAAREFVTSYVGECDESKAKVRVLMLGVIATLYEKRALTVEKNDNLQYTFQTVIMQLQMERRDVDD